MDLDIKELGRPMTKAEFRRYFLAAQETRQREARNEMYSQRRRQRCDEFDEYKFQNSMKRRR